MRPGKGSIDFFMCVKQQYHFEPPLLSHQFRSWRFAEMAVLCRMKSLGTNWYKEGCAPLTKAFSSITASCLGAYSENLWNIGGWITLVAFIHNLQHYSGVCSKQILLIRDNEHNSHAVPLHFTNYITGSHPEGIKYTCSVKAYCTAVSKIWRHCVPRKEHFREVKSCFMNARTKLTSSISLFCGSSGAQRKGSMCPVGRQTV